MSRYLRNTKDGTVYIYTAELAKRDDMDDFTDPPKYLKSKIDDHIFPWTVTLHNRNDMQPYDGELPESEVQTHLTAQQKFDNRIPLSEEDKSAYPHLAVKENQRKVDEQNEKDNPPASQPGDNTITGDQITDPDEDEVDLEAMDLDELKAFAKEHDVPLDQRVKSKERAREIIAKHFSDQESAQ